MQIAYMLVMTANAFTLIFVFYLNAPNKQAIITHSYQMQHL